MAHIYNGEVPDRIFGQLINAILQQGAKRATKYLAPNVVVKATLRGKKIDKRNNREEFLVTVGTPNYQERQFVKKCKAANEPFPVKKIQLKFAPKGK